MFEVRDGAKGMSNPFSSNCSSGSDERKSGPTEGAGVEAWFSGTETWRHR